MTMPDASVAELGTHFYPDLDNRQRLCIVARAVIREEAQMKHALVGLMMIGALPAAAAAQDIGGRYTVHGTNFDGSAYSGEADIKAISASTCQIVWTTGSTTSNGFCMRNEDAFAAGYVMGKEIGLVIYKMQPDGSLKGLWTITGKDGMGTEVLTPK
jgi:hypothetical protein